MKILRVFNNNLVLSRDSSGREVILTGRGLGFQARPGQTIDPDRVVRTFVPADGRDPDHLAELLAGIPPEQIQIVGQALVDIGMAEEASRTPTLVIALADHIHFATRRQDRGLAVAYPLRAEVMNLYPEEFARAEYLRDAINSQLPQPLEEDETIALALHLVNSAMATGDLSFTYRMTGVIQQLLDVVERTYDLDLGRDSVSVGRFITHLRYLFVRIHQHKQLSDEHSGIGDMIRSSYPDAAQCAERLAQVMELRLGAHLTHDEISYLTLHVARCVQACAEATA